MRASTSTLLRSANGARPIALPPLRTYASKTPINVSVSVGGPQAPGEYCADLVKRLDPDAWLTSYFWPRREREWFLAWRAFNASCPQRLELHHISATMSQPALAAIRFQFWRDALSIIWTGKTADGEERAVPQSPVAVLLADMRRNRPVQRYYLSQMIEARVKALSAPPSSPTLEDHLKTHSPLHSALLLGPLPLIVPPNHPQTSHLTHTLSHLSTLLTTVSLLKNLPVLVQSKRQINIPHDISTKHNIVEEEVLRKGAEARGVKDGLYEIGTRGMDELITARRELKGKGGRVDPKIATPVFLAAIPAEAYLQRLEKVDFDVFHPSLQMHDWKLAPRIWWRAQTGKI